jgi:hypothetical protein
MQSFCIFGYVLEHWTINMNSELKKNKPQSTQSRRKVHKEYQELFYSQNNKLTYE